MYLLLYTFLRSVWIVMYMGVHAIYTIFYKIQIEYIRVFKYTFIFFKYNSSLFEKQLPVANK